MLEPETSIAQYVDPPGRVSVCNLACIESGCRSVVEGVFSANHGETCALVSQRIWQDLGLIRTLSYSAFTGKPWVLFFAAAVVSVYIYIYI